MTTEEMRELDKWICENILGWFWINGYRHNYLVPKGTEGTFTDRPGLGWKVGRDETFPDGSISQTFSMYNYPLPKPTRDPAAAMMVLKRCAEKSKKSVCVCVSRIGFQVYLGGSDYGTTVQEAPTLELAICLFSKALYVKKAN